MDSKASSALGRPTWGSHRRKSGAQLVLTLRIARIRHVELVNGHFLLDGFEVRLAIALSGLLTPGLGSATI